MKQIVIFDIKSYFH